MCPLRGFCHNVWQRSMFIRPNLFYAVPNHHTHTYSQHAITIAFNCIENIIIAHRKQSRTASHIIIINNSNVYSLNLSKKRELQFCYKQKEKHDSNWFCHLVYHSMALRYQKQVVDETCKTSWREFVDCGLMQKFLDGNFGIYFQNLCPTFDCAYQMNNPYDSRRLWCDYHSIRFWIHQTIFDDKVFHEYEMTQTSQ